MTKDFKIQSSSNSLGQYGMSWMFGGIAIGLLVGLLVYLVVNKAPAPMPSATTPAANGGTVASTTTHPNASTTPSTPSQEISITEDSQTKSNAPEFNYHAVLPQLNVPTGNDVTLAEPPSPESTETKPTTETPKTTKPDTKTAEATKPTKEKEKAKEPTTTAKTGSYNAFQIGSYVTEAQAIAMQKRVKQGGLNTRVEKAQINGKEHYRVRLGPATSPEMLQKWQQTLSSMGISPLPLRM